MQISLFLYHILTENLSEDKIEWLERRLDLMDEGNEKDLFVSYSSVPRFIGKDTLKISPEQKKLGEQLRPGWELQNITADMVARWLLIINFPANSEKDYISAVKKLFSAGDMREQISLYKALPLLPFQELFSSQASEGIRSNMQSVFEAVALDNPYPSEYFDDNAWNQMVLKALFIGTPLYQIKGLDKRANYALAKMAVNFAHERWAAGRTVNPELWRLVGPFIDLHFLQDIRTLLSSSNPKDKISASLACAQSTLPEARQLLESDFKLSDALDRDKLNWDLFSSQLYKSELQEI
ncbi:MAG: EboA domain-containing protein [Cytophagaceae bacterium]